MFSAYKKFENRENILKKSLDANTNLEKVGGPPVVEKQCSSGIDSVTKVTYSSVLKFTHDESSKKETLNPALNKEYNLFKKGVSNEKSETTESP